MPYSITEARENMRNIQNQIDQARARGRELAADPNASAQAMEAQAGTIRQLSARLALVQGEIDDATRRQSAQTQAAAAAASPTGSGLHAILSSNEYARAFAEAVRNGVTPKTGRGVESYNVLFDALTEGGGVTPGEEGGFLVPDDVDHMIREKMRELNPLADLFSVESVSTNSGWRVTDTAPTSGMVSVNEMGNIPEGENPAFQRVTFTLTKYAMFLPVSNELASDEVANLFSYIARWYAKKQIITENGLLLAALGSLSATNIAAGQELKGIKTALNVALDPAIALTSNLLTNQSGFNVLDCLTDETGRPLINRDPTTGTAKLLSGKTIHVVSDAVLKNINSSDKKLAPVYVGDFKQYATLFRRTPLEVLSTNIGGNAWRTDSVEVRGISRMGVSKFDTDAAVLRTLTL